MKLSVLSVAFPFATVSPDSVGGAEQILSALDRALVAAGQHSIVIAQEGSQIAGELIPMPRPEGVISEIGCAEIWARYRAEIDHIQSIRNIDVIHCHGIDYYFDEEVRPRLDHQRRLIGPIPFARKRRLLTAARCLLVPSVVAETSSLVAREAQACGTPVIAFPNGALTQVIEPGRTGFLVDSVEAMASAIHDCGGIDPMLCRDAARERFCDRRMIRDYFAHYEYLTQRSHDHIAT